MIRLRKNIYLVYFTFIIVFKKRKMIQLFLRLIYLTSKNYYSATFLLIFPLKYVQDML